MAYDYGYGELENRLIDLFRSGTPDFEAAEKLIKQGADINAEGEDDGENVLSEILEGYSESEQADDGDYDCCDDDDCDDDDDDRDERENSKNLNPNLGASMCAIIRFFLAHGFDVTKRDGLFGAQCLSWLVYSTFDRYMIEATKILLDTGAKNRNIYPGEDSTPWDAIGLKISSYSCCDCDIALANIYEAVYQIYQALEDGRPYGGVDSYEIAVGRKILKVLAESGGERPVFFPLSSRGFYKDKCYISALYFVYDGGVLISTRDADFWTDTVLPDDGLIDVSEHFKCLVGDTIKSFSYDYREVRKGPVCHTQPITIIETNSGRKIKFSANFGEVKKEDRAAYYELLEDAVG